ncbi:MAG: hypothetical protein LUC98_07265 [Lachnospiraceae bacterium]|nr:hypothetical protein [Lachnospiraceae bacterium]
MKKKNRQWMVIVHTNMKIAVVDEQHIPLEEVYGCLSEGRQVLSISERYQDAHVAIWFNKNRVVGVRRRMEVEGKLVDQPYYGMLFLTWREEESWNQEMVVVRASESGVESVYTNIDVCELNARAVILRFFLENMAPEIGAQAGIDENNHLVLLEPPSD